MKTLFVIAIVVVVFGVTNCQLFGDFFGGGWGGHGRDHRGPGRGGPGRRGPQCESLRGVSRELDRFQNGILGCLDRAISRSQNSSNLSVLQEIRNNIAQLGDSVRQSINSALNATTATTSAV